MLKSDCSHFFGDRPCAFHKYDGRKCFDCSEYDPIEFKILIIKLDAIGDVLRTTSILPPLKNKYPKSHITWCTRKVSGDIFIDNPYVNELIFVEEDAYFRIKAEQFDLVINLDTSKFSSSIASTATGTTKQGFILNPKSFVEPTSQAANEWLLMSAFDDVKKENKKSYQKLMYDILELDYEVALPVINLPGAAKKKISSLAGNWGLNKNVYTIGLNIGVGTKWPSKGWPINRWKELIQLLKNDHLNILLLGGSDEAGKMNELKNKFHFLINTGSENTIMEFASIVDVCDIIVTVDTLALHIGSALEKKIIALFGPTSSNEIELYGKGIKITAQEDCKCYYHKHCSQKISCMENITADKVYKAILSLIK